MNLIFILIFLYHVGAVKNSTENNTKYTLKSTLFLMFSFDYTSHFRQKVLKVRKFILQMTVTTSFNLSILTFKESRELQIFI